MGEGGRSGEWAGANLGRGRTEAMKVAVRYLQPLPWARSPPRVPVCVRSADLADLRFLRNPSPENKSLK